MNEECKYHLSKCQDSEANKLEVIAEAERQYQSIVQEAKKLELAKHETAKERRKLLNTRSAILCSRCQKPLVDLFDVKREGLGSRTSGDGEMNDTEVKFLLLLLCR